MRRLIFAALSGGLFGLGLLVSGMVDTRKVIGWLDLFGAWDPTLAFVLGAAVIPMFFVWRLAEARGTSMLGTPVPARVTGIDRSLAVGSALFGAGWGLAGLCPGPAMASLGFGGLGGVVFLLAMGAGMVAAPGLRRRLATPA